MCVKAFVDVGLAVILNLQTGSFCEKLPIHFHQPEHFHHTRADNERPRPVSQDLLPTCSERDQKIKDMKGENCQKLERRYGIEQFFTDPLVGLK